MWSVRFQVWPSKRSLFNEVSVWHSCDIFHRRVSRLKIKSLSEDHYKAVKTDWTAQNTGDWGQSVSRQWDGHCQDRERAQGGDSGPESAAWSEEHSTSCQTWEEALQWRREEEGREQGGPEQADQPETGVGTGSQQVSHWPQAGHSDGRHGLLRQTGLQQCLLRELAEVRAAPDDRIQKWV